MVPHMISPRIHTILKEMNRSPDVPFLPGVSHFLTSQAGVRSIKVRASFTPPSITVGAITRNSRMLRGMAR